MEINKHKWSVLQNGVKICKNCGSRISNQIGFPKYYEIDIWGCGEYVNWYPRCNPQKKY